MLFIFSPTWKCHRDISKVILNNVDSQKNLRSIYQELYRQMAVETEKWPVITGHQSLFAALKVAYNYHSPAVKCLLNIYTCK